MHLYANGCSYTWGAELADHPKLHICIDDEYRLKHSWPGIVSSKLEIMDSFTNDGEGGGSNDRIVRTTIKFISDWIAEGKNLDDLMVMICWTHEERRELYARATCGPQEAYCSLLPGFVPDWTVDLMHFYRLYVTYLNHAEETSTRKLSQILLIQSLLKSYQIPYLFLESCWPYGRWVAEHFEISDMYNLVDASRFYNFGEEPIKTVIERAGYSMKPRLHPTEEGHEYISGILADFITKHELWKNK